MIQKPLKRAGTEGYVGYYRDPYYRDPYCAEGAHYYMVWQICVRPAGRARLSRFSVTLPRMVHAQRWVESETQGIDLTRRAESIGEGIRSRGHLEVVHPDITPSVTA